MVPRRPHLRNRTVGFYTPFGVRCFGTAVVADGLGHCVWGFYTPFGVRCFGTAFKMRHYSLFAASFYTPFGVRCFGTVAREEISAIVALLYALRREVLRHGTTACRMLFAMLFLYALRREVLRHPTPLHGPLTSMFEWLLHARPARTSE